MLAAGGSSRLGRPKQLIQYDGETLLARAVRLAREAGCQPIIVVLGFEADRMKNALAGCDVVTVVNPAWWGGMASSLRAGVAAWSESAADDSNVLLMVCDQPKVEAEDLRKLLAIHASEKRSITAAAYSGRLGVPAVFRRNMIDELMAVTGDQGARAVIERHANQAGRLDLPTAALDVDWPDDLTDSDDSESNSPKLSGESRRPERSGG